MKGIEIKNIASTVCYCLKFASASRSNAGYGVCMPSVSVELWKLPGNYFSCPLSSSRTGSIGCDISTIIFNRFQRLSGGTARHDFSIESY